MSRNKQQSQEHTMTRKDALNILFDLREAYTDLLIDKDYQQYKDKKVFHDQVWDALWLLTDAVYGAHHFPQLPWPCEVCRHRLAEGSVHEKGGDSLTWCCPSCRKKLHAEGKVREEVSA